MPRAADAAPFDPEVFASVSRAESLDAIADRAELEHVHLRGEREGVTATRLSLDTVRSRALHISGARLPHLIAFRTWWEDCDLSNADLGHANIRSAVLRRCRLTGLVAAEASLRDVLFESCKLDFASFHLATLERVTFRDCVLSDAELGESIQRTVRYDGCDLRAADFSKARLTAVDLRGSDLERLRGLGNLRGARISSEQLVGLAPALAIQLGIRVED